MTCDGHTQVTVWHKAWEVEDCGVVIHSRGTVDMVVAHIGGDD